jgi:hypothetical protein
VVNLTANDFDNHFAPKLPRNALNLFQYNQGVMA